MHEGVDREPDTYTFGHSGSWAKNVPPRVVDFTVGSGEAVRDRGSRRALTSTGTRSVNFARRAVLRETLNVECARA
jgi:hypothetical protein